MDIQGCSAICVQTVHGIPNCGAISVVFRFIWLSSDHFGPFLAVPANILDTLFFSLVCVLGSCSSHFDPVGTSVWLVPCFIDLSAFSGHPTPCCECINQFMVV